MWNSVKKVRWKIHRKTPVQELKPATLFKKTPAQVFSRGFCEVFKNTFFNEHLRWLLLGIWIKNLNLFKLLSFSFLSRNKEDMTSQRLCSSLHITINLSLSSIFFEFANILILRNIKTAKSLVFLLSNISSFDVFF